MVYIGADQYEVITLTEESVCGLQGISQNNDGS